MVDDRIIKFFLPHKLKNKLHPHYDSVYIILTGMLIASFLLIILPVPLLFFSPLPAYFFIIAATAIATCFLIKAGIDYRIPTFATFIITLSVYVYICSQSGGINSPYIATFYGILLTASWAGKLFGYFAFAGISSAFYILFNYSPQVNVENDLSNYGILLFHICLAIFMFIFFILLKGQYDKARQQIRREQFLRINELNRLVQERNEQLNTIRQTLAADFHDETGNLLSAITRQATMLKLDLSKSELDDLSDNITLNSERLYASSKDFLWGINNQSDNPEALFIYLTSFGQHYYNQFDISFSVSEINAGEKIIGQLPPFAARHIIFIFKEAMTNVIKHANANEVVLSFHKKNNEAVFILTDNGGWKIPSSHEKHNGLNNMKKRSEKNGFDLEINTSKKGTTITLVCPLHFFEVDEDSSKQTNKK